MSLLACESRRRRSFRAELRQFAGSADAAIKRFTYLLKGRRLTVVDRYLERSLGTIHHPNGVGFNLVEVCQLRIGGARLASARLFYHYVKTDAQRKLVRTASLPNCQCPLSEPATAKQRHYEGDAHQ